MVLKHIRSWAIFASEMLKLSAVLSDRNIRKQDCTIKTWLTAIYTADMLLAVFILFAC
jgi:hypothetical protein